jgi:serpin B
LPLKLFCFITKISSDLIALGARLPFTSGQADFSGINASNELFISSVIHQAVVEVNEQGTEAAAATAVIMTRCMAMPISHEVIHDFICDRPFMFFIHDNTNKCVLFVGKYVKP